MSNHQLVNGQPQSIEHNRNSRADLENNVGTPDPVTQQSGNQQANPRGQADATISRNAMPDTDDSVVEAMDESAPGSSTLDANVSEPANPQPGSSSHPAKAA